MTPGVFDKGGIARYNRFQIRALRDEFGEENVRVFSLMGRLHDDFEEPFAVDFAGAMPLSLATRALFFAEVVIAANRFRPDVVLSAHVNMGPLAYAVCRATWSILAQNIYGREIWSEYGLTFARREALKRTAIVISDCHNTADRAVDLRIVRRRPEVVWDCVDTERYSRAATNWNALPTRSKNGSLLLRVGSLSA
jgi:phosphatidyl-myo-inositol dimannoside synthase